MKSTKRALGLVVILALGCLGSCSSDDDPIAAPPIDLTTLDTQAKIDAFGAQEHTDFADRLVIGVENQPNSSITNLDALSSLTSVKGLAIFYNDELADLSGLENLAAIGTDGLVIEENPKLTSIDGLSVLESIDGDAVIRRNDIIASLGSQTTLSVIGGSLAIDENLSLENFSFFSHVNSIGGTVVITKNTLLPDLIGLRRLSSVGGGLIFLDNPNLSDYCGLRVLWFFGFNGIYSAVRNALNPTLEELKAGNCN